MTGSSPSVRSRQCYVNLVERYFAELDQKRSLDAVLECFTDDAVLVFMPDFTAAGRAAIREAFREAFEDVATTLVHRKFVYCVDIEAERCSCQFDVEFISPDGTAERYSNCNVFVFEDNRFREVYVYTTGPLGGEEREP